MGNEEVLESLSEYDLTLKAKKGDAGANIMLWERYKQTAATILRPVPDMDEDDKFSEAYMIFLHKLDIFDPAKVTRDPETFTFSYMFIGGIKNLRSRLFAEWRRENCVISSKAFEEDYADAKYPFRIFKKKCAKKWENSYVIKEKFDFTASPEQRVGKDLEKRKRTFYGGLNSLQARILRLRREGKTYREIGAILGISDTNVRYKCAGIKRRFNEIFGTRYPVPKNSRDYYGFRRKKKTANDIGGIFRKKYGIKRVGKEKF